MELDIKSLLGDEHVEMLKKILENFVYKNPTKLNLYVPQEVPVEFAKLNTASIGRVSPVKWQKGSVIGFDMELSAEITTGLWYDNDGALIPDYAMKCEQKFVVSCSGTLTPDQTLEKFRVRAIRVMVEKRYEENSLWGMIANAHHDAVKTALSAYIVGHPQGLQLPTPPWVQRIESASLCGFDITSIGGLTDLPGMDIGFEIIAAAEIEAGERNKRGILHKSPYQQWFTLECRSNIEDLLQDFSVDAISIKAVARSEGSPMGALVPFIPERQLELEALHLLKEFGFDECIYSPKAVDPALLAQRMGLTIQYRHLSKEKSVFGAVFMEDCEASFCRPGEDDMEPETVQAGTIVVDEEASQKRPTGSVNNTVVHECVHWHRHRKAYYLTKLIAGKQPISCLVGGGIEGDITNSLLGVEWQATALAPRIQMPYPAFRRETRRLIQAQRESSPHAPLIDLLPSVIEQLSERFQVSKQAAKIRLLETKCPEARGVLEYVDGHYIRPYGFAPGALEKNQTFTVSAGELAQLYEESEELRKCLQSGKYTVVESHVCLNDPSYVFGLGGDMPMLTEYARLHVDECCLKFAAVRDDKSMKWETLYSMGVLYREEYMPISVKLEIAEDEADNESDDKPKPRKRRTRDEVNQADAEVDTKMNEFNRRYDIYWESIKNHLTTIQKYLRKMTSFSNAVEALRVWREYSHTELAAKAKIEYRTLMYMISPTFGKDPTPSLDTVFRLCIALELPYPLSRKLMELAGFTLNDSFTQMAYDFALRNYNTFPVQSCIDFIAKFKQPTYKKKEKAKEEGKDKKSK